MANQNLNYLVSGKSPVRLGNAHPNISPYEVMPTEDGHLILAVGNDGQFARLCTILGLEGVANDERFSTNKARVAHKAEVRRIVSTETAKWKKRDLLTACEQNAVPAGPINTIGEMFEDPQVKARGLQIAMQHPQAGEVPLVASPIRLSDTPVSYRHTPPQLGQHTDEVLTRHLGLTAEVLQTFRDNGVLG